MLSDAKQSISAFSWTKLTKIPHGVHPERELKKSLRFAQGDSEGLMRTTSGGRMLVGHFAAAMIGKRIEPKLSLGTLVLAAMLPDLLWCVFLLSGIEQVEFKPGLGAANYLVATSIAWSHGLVTGVVWAGLLAGAYYWRRRGPREAWVLFAAVLSHWVLDFASHRPDMPIVPGFSARFGLGLWASVPVTLIVEGGLWLVALIVYVRTTRARNIAAHIVLWLVAAILTFAWYNNIAGPPPPNPKTAPITSLIFFTLVVTWAYGMNRLRPAQNAPVKPWARPSGPH